jgi:Fur family ferric uptake transcriptional regulator
MIIIIIMMWPLENAHHRSGFSFRWQAAFLHPQVFLKGIAMGSSEDFIRTIRGRGLKLTRPRQLILEILESSRGHLDAEMIFAKARERDNRIGLATVYRTLALLKELGLAEEHDLGEDHGHFEAADKEKPHFHFACLKCGKIVEFESPEVVQLAQSLCRKKGLSVSEVHLWLRGHCRQCRPSGSRCLEKP